MNLRAPRNLRTRLLTIAALLTASTVAGQKPAPKANADSQSAGKAAVARGSALFHDKCEICHFSNSESQKLGPGLKGIYTRGKFADHRTVTDDLMEKWIKNGSPMMPSYNGVLKPDQIHELILYIKTL